MEEYRSHLLGQVIPDSERAYFDAISLAYKKAVALLEKTNGKYTTARLNNIISEIGKELLAINKEFRGAFKNELPDIINMDLTANEQEFAFTAQSNGDYPNLYLIPKADIKNLITTDRLTFTYKKADGTVSYSNISVSSMLLSPTEKAVKDASSIINAGAALGHSPDKIARDLSHSFTTVQKRNVRTVVNTLMGEASAKTDEQFSRENEEFIKYFEFVATLDQSTSSICRSLDGRRWNEYPPARYVPDLHPNCRSKIVNIPYGYERGVRPVNIMTASDKRKAEQMRKDALKIKDTTLRNQAKLEREEFLKSKMFYSKENLTFKQAADIYPPLNNKKMLTVDEYESLLGL